MRIRTEKELGKFKCARINKRRCVTKTDRQKDRSVK